MSNRRALTDDEKDKARKDINEAAKQLSELGLQFNLSPAPRAATALGLVMRTIGETAHTPKAWEAAVQFISEELRRHEAVWTRADEHDYQAQHGLRLANATRQVLQVIELNRTFLAGDEVS